MKSFYVILLTLVFSNIFAQKQRLIVGGTTPSIYIDHKVAPDETFASIASIYNIAPDTLSEFNNIDYYEGKLRAKTLKVPLKASNFTQKGIADSGQVLVPVYYMTGYSENVQQIITKANKLPLSSLKKWNIIPPTGIVKGMPLLIGFLKADPAKLAYFEDTSATEFARVDIPATKPKIEKKTDTAAVAANDVKKPTTQKPTIAKPVTVIKTDSLAVANTGKKNDTKKADVKSSLKAVDSLAITKKATTPKLKPEVIKDTTSVAKITPIKKEPKPKPEVKKDTTSIAKNVPIKKEPKAVVAKPDIKKDTSVVNTTANNTGKKSNTIKKPEIKDTSNSVINTAKNTTKPANKPKSPRIDSTTVASATQKEIVTNKPTINNTTTPVEKTVTPSSFADLTFEGIYSGEKATKPQRQLTGDASYFESKTGWKDNKYYVLMPNVATGTIVKVTSLDNRSVYAKVLGTMPEMKNNEGILLRLSNAAVAALGVSDNRFPVVVSFY